MNLLRPDYSHARNFYEIGKYKLIWNLSLIVSVIFGILSVVFVSIDISMSGIYASLLSVSLFSLYYLKRFKKTNPVFWLYTITTSVIIIGSLQSIHYLLHYKDILWMVCIIGFAYIGLHRKYAFMISMVHAISFIFFLQTNLNNNIETVQELSRYNLLLITIESILAFGVLITLMIQYLRLQKHTNSELKNAKLKYVNIVENINDALIQDDINGNIIFWNTKFLEIFGFSNEDMSTLNFVDFINKDFHEIAQSRHMMRIKGHKVEDQVLYRGNTKDGAPLWIEININPIYDKGIIVGTQSLIRDVTVRKEQEIELEKINQELIKIEEAERERIAYELHDGLNQLLVVAKLNVDLETGKEKLLEILDAAISESRDISQNLVPRDINEFGLITALKILIRKAELSGKLSIKLSLEEESEIILNENTQFNIYRIVQECINNTIKHAKADKADLSISVSDNQLNISFSNNGMKISEDKIKHQNFLIAIKRRVRILNGAKRIVNNVDGDVAIEFNFPVDIESNSLMIAV